MSALSIALLLTLGGGFSPGAGSAGGYATIQEDGTPLAQRTTVNFTGGAVTCSDSGGITVCAVSAGAGNFGTFAVSFGSGDLSLYDSAEATVAATWVSSSSAILLTPKCVTTVGWNTVDNCLVSKLACSVSSIVASTSFNVICHAPFTASGGYTISYTGG